MKKRLSEPRQQNELLTILKDERIPLGATVDVATSCHMSDDEVWYDEGTNTVILK